jgi:hypothetical protein
MSDIELRMHIEMHRTFMCEYHRLVHIDMHRAYLDVLGVE